MNNIFDGLMNRLNMGEEGISIMQDTWIICPLKDLYKNSHSGFIHNGQKQPKCPSTGEGANILQSTNTMEYYSAIKRTNINKSHRHYVKWVKPDTTEYVSGDCIYIKYKARKTKLWHKSEQWVGGKEERLAKGTKDLCGLEENVLYLRSIKQMTCNPFILFKEGDMGTPQRKEQRQPTSLNLLVNYTFTENRLCSKRLHLWNTLSVMSLAKELVIVARTRDLLIYEADLPGECHI